MITIDGKEYDLHALSEKARQHLATLQFVDAEIKRRNDQLVVLHAARNTFAAGLREALPEQAPAVGDNNGTIQFNL